ADPLERGQPPEDREIAEEWYSLGRGPEVCLDQARDRHGLPFAKFDRGGEGSRVQTGDVGSLDVGRCCVVASADRRAHRQADAVAIRDGWVEEQLHAEGNELDAPQRAQATQVPVRCESRHRELTTSQERCRLAIHRGQVWLCQRTGVVQGPQSLDCDWELAVV